MHRTLAESKPGIGMGGLLADSLPVVGGGGMVIARLLIDVTHTVENFGRVVGERERIVECLDSLTRLSKGGIAIGEGEIGIDFVGVDNDSVLEGIGGFAPVLEPVVDRAEAVPAIAAVRMLADMLGEEVFSLEDGTCLVPSGGKVVERAGLVGVDFDRFEIVDDRLVGIAHAVVLVGNVAINHVELTAVGSGLEVVFNGLGRVAHDTVEGAEGIADIGIVGVVVFQFGEDGEGFLVATLNAVEVGATHTDRVAEGEERFGILDSGLETLDVVDFKIVVDDYLELVDVEEDIMPVTLLLETEHQLTNIGVISFKTVFIHLEAESNSYTTFGCRIWVGVGNIRGVDIGLEEETEGERGREGVFGREFGHPDLATRGNLTFGEILVNLADVGFVAVVGEIELEDNVAL